MACFTQSHAPVFPIQHLAQTQGLVWHAFDLRRTLLHKPSISMHYHLAEFLQRPGEPSVVRDFWDPLWWKDWKISQAILLNTVDLKPWKPKKCFRKRRTSARLLPTKRKLLKCYNQIAKCYNQNDYLQVLKFFSSKSTCPNLPSISIG